MYVVALLLLSPNVFRPDQVIDTLPTLETRVRMNFVTKGMPADQARRILGVSSDQCAQRQTSGRFSAELYVLGQDHLLALGFHRDAQRHEFLGDTELRRK